ncbi:MAG: TonB-dependent receptor plug domain-containing protein [Bacteroidales bacterium]|nr:TonB-dependent receptor plug domain-containing protein [Bacteroidales bacterium]
MKKTLSLLLLSFVLAACGSAYVQPGQKAVNVGYGEVTQESLTYSVSSVDMSQIENGTYNTIYDYLEGRVPGVRVIKTGDSTASIQVRGINSINSSTEPLIIVDGTEVRDLSFINPRDVKSVDVLKDGSAAIYGSRGAGGVIIITLKR